MSRTDHSTNVVVSNLHNVGRASDIYTTIWSCDFQTLETRVTWASRDIFIEISNDIFEQEQ